MSTLVDSFDDDVADLARSVGEIEERIDDLGARSDRTAAQQRRADGLFDSSRRLRHSFMTRHATRVYSELTDGGEQRPRLGELVYAAADRFPGLVPTRAQIQAERRCIQAGKEGREIDQGIFFRALLRVPEAGRHLAESMLLPSPAARARIDDFRREGRVDLGPVLLERRGHAAHLTVQNLHCLNAEDDGLIEAMETAVDLALLDDEVHVGVLRGGVMTHTRYAGRRVFSAGINLRDLRNGQISFVDFLLGRELGYISKILRGLAVDGGDHAFPDRSLQKPWIAAVDAFAIGGGMQLLMVFDWVIAADDAYFSLPAAHEGIVPGAGNLRLGRLVGGRRARRIILAGHTIRATDADAALVCDEVVPPDGVDAAVEAAVRELDNAAVVANRRMLNLAEEPLDDLRSYLAEFAFTQATRMYSADVIDKVDRAWSRSSRAD